MPFIPIKTNDPEITIGMWRVEEDENFFLSRLNIYENEQSILDRISHPVKRLEWLSSRLCLKQILKISHKVESLNEFSGKPYLSDHSHNISYSHSNLVAGAIASRSAEVAIDIENLEKKRKLESRFLFMHPEELDYYDAAADQRVFYLFWSAKETLYKVFGKRGIVFKENLIIRPENTQLPDRGSVKGIVQENGYTKEYTLEYRFFDNVVLTYTVDPQHYGMLGTNRESRASELLGAG